MTQAPLDRAIYRLDRLTYRDNCIDYPASADRTEPALVIRRIVSCAERLLVEGRRGHALTSSSLEADDGQINRIRVRVEGVFENYVYRTELYKWLNACQELAD